MHAARFASFVNFYRFSNRLYVEVLSCVIVSVLMVFTLQTAVFPFSAQAPNKKWRKLSGAEWFSEYEGGYEVNNNNNNL